MADGSPVRPVTSSIRVLGGEGCSLPALRLLPRGAGGKLRIQGIRYGGGQRAPARAFGYAVRMTPDQTFAGPLQFSGIRVSILTYVPRLQSGAP